MKKKQDITAKIAGSRESLSEFLNRFAEDNYKYGSLQFAIYDYELYENCREMGDPAPRLTGIYREIVADYLSGKATENIVPAWKRLREDIISQMEAITSFTDKFTLYEYLCNRAELNFTTPTDTDKIPDNDDDIAREILRRVFADKDNNTINLKLQTVISQLPVRITVDKFMNILEDSLKLYINGEQSALEKVRYMIRSAAGLYKPQTRADYEDILISEQSFDELSFKSITEDEFSDAAETLQSVTTQLSELSEHFGELQNAVNQLGIVLLTDPYVDKSKLTESCATEKLTRWISEHADSRDAVPEDLFELFRTGEGQLEELSDALGKLAAMMDHLMDTNAAAIRDMDLSDMAKSLEYCGILSSGSLYAPLEDEENGDIADEASVAKVTEELKAELKNLFEGMEPKKRRAVMASVLGELPVFFPSKNAVMDYVLNSLKNCSDKAEKTMSVMLINSAFDEIEGN